MLQFPTDAAPISLETIPTIQTAQVIQKSYDQNKCAEMFCGDCINLHQATVTLDFWCYYLPYIVNTLEFDILIKKRPKSSFTFIHWPACLILDVILFACSLAKSTEFIQASSQEGSKRVQSYHSGTHLTGQSAGDVERENLSKCRKQAKRLIIRYSLPAGRWQ